MDNRVIFVLILLGVAVSGGILYMKRGEIQPPEIIGEIQSPLHGVAIGQPAPHLALNDLQGNERRIEAFRGKVVLINFWATWCPPCLTEMPSLVSIHQKLKDQGFEVIAVNLDEKSDPVKTFATQQALPFTVLLDPKGISAQAYLVYGLPYTIILDREGNVRHKIFGGYEWDRGKPFEKVKSLL